jgi:hypothetical protein
VRHGLPLLLGVELHHGIGRHLPRHAGVLPAELDEGERVEEGASGRIVGEELGERAAGALLEELELPHGECPNVTLGDP